MPLKADLQAYTKKLIDPEFCLAYDLTPHVTIRYGIIEDDPAKIAMAICPFIPIRMMLGMTNLFPATEEREFDVLYIEVYGESLKRLRKKVEEEVACVEPEYTYIPHMTMGYLRPHAGFQYLGESHQNNKKVVCDSVVFLKPTGEKTRIYTDGRIEEYK